MVNDRQVEPYCGLRADLGHRIFGRQNPPLHCGELEMPGKKVLDLIEVVRRGDEVVIKAYNYSAVGVPDGHVLDAAFTGTRVVQMLKRRRAGGER
jgi:hypothetical protein